MKTFCLLVSFFSSVLFLSAQDQEILIDINRKLANYFERYPDEKVFIMTDKVRYKPGETVWFRTFVTDINLQRTSKGNSELIAKLYDEKGKSEIQQIFKLNNGSARCDITLPKELTKGNYFLCVYTSTALKPEDISITLIRIDPDYNDQWIIESRLKDSIPVPGQINAFDAVVRDLSGKIQKNSTIRYQLINGTEIIEKGKIKTNDKGQLTIPFTLPARTNGGPFFIALSANRDESKSEFFLPSSLDSIKVRFYPEGGTLIPGISSKVGFTAFNKWGLPVNVEGEIRNQDGENIAHVRTFDKGLGMFALFNAGNQQFKFVITGKTGQNQSFNLPDPDPNGLLLSVVKNDPEFIYVNLVFADKQKHSIALTMTQGRNLSWAADLDINQGGRIKIPLDSIPHGINLLSAFSSKGDLLAERIIYIDKKQELKIEILPGKSSLTAGESMNVKVRLTDEKNQPVSGNISIAVADQYRMDATKPRIDESLLIDSGLENPFSLISGALKGKITQSILLDVYLIANRLTNFNWSGITKPTSLITQDVKRAPKDNREGKKDTPLSEYIEKFALKYRFLSTERLTDAVYFANNPGLFTKTPKVFKQNTVALDNQRKMFQSSSSILDVIKTIKPFKIQNNQIVFVGSENSINYQGGALIVLDGQMLGTDVSQLTGINPSEVDHVNVSTKPMDIQRYTGLNSVGIIEIFQKKATMTEVTPVSESAEKYEQGFRVPGIFPATPAAAIRDTRTTLLWIPEQKVDETGLFEFSVTAGSVISDFVVEVQGISENGRAGSGRAVFRVAK